MDSSEFYIRQRYEHPYRYLSKSTTRNRSESPIRNRSESPIRNQSESPIRNQSESPIRNQSESPIRNQSESPIRYRSRSSSPIRYRSRSSSPIRYRLRSPSPIRYRSRSPSSIRYDSRSPSPIRNYSKSSAAHKEYLFPIGVHKDIDQNIMENMDLGTIINLLKIDRSLKFKTLIAENINKIIENSEKLNDDDYVNIFYELLELNEVDIFKLFEISNDLMVKLYNEVARLLTFEFNTKIIINLLSILDEFQIIKFTEAILPELFIDYTDNLYYDIKYSNKILNLALEIKNVTMINTIQSWYTDSKLNKLTFQLLKLEQNLKL